LSNTKILINGCGMTYSKQKVKTWVNMLQLAGCFVVDVSGPAVSNQWIINKTLLGIEQHPDIKTVIIQLTGLAKLDVDVDQTRINELVKPDPLRNFVIDSDFEIKSKEQIGISGVWPSSVSDHHESKKQWRKWLFSPALEIEDLYCKLVLLENYCQHRQIKLHVYQGYDIPWTAQQTTNLQNIIKNIDSSWYPEYVKSSYYQQHNHLNGNPVPCLGFQIALACVVSQLLPEIVQNKLTKFKSTYDSA
jgi:hypothetical protein